MNKSTETFIGRYLSFLFIVLLLVSSCKKSDIPPSEPGRTRDTTITTGPETINTPVNKWVTENMRIYYYWNEGIKADQQLDFKLTPPDFFETLLDENDRFSWIENVDKLGDDLAGVTTSTGINFNLWFYKCDAQSNNCENIFGLVRYVIPGSPAELAGVKRGMIFYAVNDQSLTPANYEAILIDPYINGKGFKISLASIDQENNIAPNGVSINLVATRVVEPSVYLTKTFTTNSGKKVGYIFYNRFLNEKSDELFKVFNDFKGKGITDLVLDLRYNLGGGIAVSGVLSALIKPNYTKADVFVQYKYNALLNEEFDQDPDGESRDKSFGMLFPGTGKIDENLSDEEYKVAAAIIANQIDEKVKTANLNLPKVYILATGNSASASELVIHNLAPYMEVIHIGETTVGKNEGSITIEDERVPRQIDWAIQPIIVKLADKNGQGDYEMGLKPDYEIDETATLKLFPIGSEEDPLLGKALTLIDPTMSKSTLTTLRTSKILQQSFFSKVNQFNEKLIKPLPVLVNGTIDKEVFRTRERIN